MRQLGFECKVKGIRKALGKNLSIQEVKCNSTCTFRVFVHPKYRIIGLGEKILAETLTLAGKSYVEMLAFMAKYNPFL